MTLVVIETHPVQYHAPVYQALVRRGVPVTAVYGSDFSVVGYRDREFGADVAWDTDLLSGYQTHFLSRVADGGAQSAETVTTVGLTALLQQLQPQAILLTGYSPRFNREACLIAAGSGQPMLLRAETTDHAVSRSRLKSLIRDQLLWRFYQRCAFLLYIGQHSRAHYQRLGVPAHKLIFAPYSVDLRPFQIDEAARARLRTETRHALGLREDQFILLFVGKLSSRKRPDLLITATRLLPDPLRTRIALVMLGDGELRTSLEAQAAEDPSIPLVITGFRNQHALSPIYHAADLLVLPSAHGETWGLVVNEALHHGLPVVVSEAVGCGPDLVQPGVTGTVFTTDSADDLAAAILCVLPRRDDPRQREVCRRHVAGYTLERAAAGIAAAYWMCCAHHKHTPR